MNARGQGKAAQSANLLGDHKRPWIVVILFCKQWVKRCINVYFFKHHVVYAKGTFDAPSAKVERQDVPPWINFKDRFELGPLRLQIIIKRGLMHRLIPLGGAHRAALLSVSLPPGNSTLLKSVFVSAKRVGVRDG